MAITRLLELLREAKNASLSTSFPFSEYNFELFLNQTFKEKIIKAQNYLECFSYNLSQNWYLYFKALKYIFQRMIKH